MSGKHCQVVLKIIFDEWKSADQLLDRFPGKTTENRKKYEP